MREPPQSVEKAGLGLLEIAVTTVGIVLCVAGVVFAFMGEGAASVVPGVLAVIAGLITYVLGKQRIGGIMAVLGIAVVVFGLAASQGVIPGFQQTDHEYPNDIFKPTTP